MITQNCGMEQFQLGPVVASECVIFTGLVPISQNALLVYAQLRQAMRNALMGHLEGGSEAAILRQLTCSVSFCSLALLMGDSWARMARVL